MHEHVISPVGVLGHQVRRQRHEGDVAAVRAQGSPPGPRVALGAVGGDRHPGGLPALAVVHEHVTRHIGVPGHQVRRQRPEDDVAAVRAQGRLKPVGRSVALGAVGGDGHPGGLPALAVVHERVGTVVGVPGHQVRRPRLEGDVAAVRAQGSPSPPGIRVALGAVGGDRHPGGGGAGWGGGGDDTAGGTPGVPGTVGVGVPHPSPETPALIGSHGGVGVGLGPGDIHAPAAVGLTPLPLVGVRAGEEPDALCHRQGHPDLGGAHDHGGDDRDGRDTPAHPEGQHGNPDNQTPTHRRPPSPWSAPAHVVGAPYKLTRRCAGRGCPRVLSGPGGTPGMEVRRNSLLDAQDVLLDQGAHEVPTRERQSPVTSKTWAGCSPGDPGWSSASAVYRQLPSG